MAALLLVAIVALPLVFDPALDDGFALPKVSVLRVLGLLGATIFLGYVLSGGRLVRGGDPWIDVPLACFATLMITASVASVDPVQSFGGEPYQYQGVVTVLLYLGSFYLARLSLGTPGGFRWVLTAIVGTGSVVSIYGVTQALGRDPFWSGLPPDGRLISSVGQANDLAAYLDLVVVAALGLWPAAGRAARIGLMAVVAVSLVALALTFSRGGYIGLAVALGVLLVPRYRAPARRGIFVVLTLAAAVLLVALAIPSVRAIGERVVERAVAATDLGEGSIRFHLDLWRVGTQIALEHPLLGSGPETFPVVFRPYLEQVLTPDRAEILGRFRLESPHNEFIGIAAEVGLPALVAYVAFILACARACFERAKARGGPSRSISLVVLATLASHVVTNFFKTPDVTTSEIFWITIGAGFAAMLIAQADPEEASQGAAGAR